MVAVSLKKKRYDQYKDAWDTCVVVEVKFSCMIPRFLCGSVRIFNLKIIIFFLIFSCRFQLGTELKLFAFSTATKEELIVSSWIIPGSLRRYIYIYAADLVIGVWGV